MTTQSHRTSRCEAILRFFANALPEASMHPSLQPLQKAADATQLENHTIPAALTQHIEHCPHCQEALAYHASLRVALAHHGDAKPQYTPAQYAERAMANAWQNSTKQPRYAPLQWAAFGALATALIVVLLSQLQPQNPYPPPNGSFASTTAPKTTNTTQVTKTPLHPPKASNTKASIHETSTHKHQTNRAKSRCHCRHDTGPKRIVQVLPNARRLRKHKSKRRAKWMRTPKTKEPTFASGWHRFPPPPPPAKWPAPPPPPEPATPQKTKRTAKEQPPPPPPLPEGEAGDPLLKRLFAPKKQKTTQPKL